MERVEILQAVTCHGRLKKDWYQVAKDAINPSSHNILFDDNSCAQIKTRNEKKHLKIITKWYSPCISINNIVDVDNPMGT